MLVSIDFEFSLYRFCGCRQFRVSAYPLSRPADGRTVYSKPAGHFASGDRQVLRRNIAGQKPAHDRCDRNAARAQKQIHVVGHKNPSITGCSRLVQQTREPLAKILPVRVIFEYRFAFDSSDEDMMQGVGASMPALQGM